MVYHVSLLEVMSGSRRVDGHQWWCHFTGLSRSSRVVQKSGRFRKLWCRILVHESLTVLENGLKDSRGWFSIIESRLGYFLR